MICQVCGVSAPTKKVAFYENVGALFVRFHRSIEGRLCKSCVHGHFWRMTGKTLFLGWWGTISLIVTPFILLNNVGRYLFCLTMASVPPGATRAILTEEAVQKLLPLASDLFSRLQAGEKIDDVATAVAEKSGTTPAQVLLFVHAAAQAMNSKSDS